MSRPQSTALDEIRAALGPIDGLEILDVGCGRGQLAAHLSTSGARVVALDPEADAVAAVRTAGKAAEVVQASAADMPFDDDRFDGVVVLNSLHHVPGVALGEALREIARVSRPRAPIVIVEPLAEGGFFEAMRALEDETDVRRMAQSAIGAAIGQGGNLALCEIREFDRVDVFASLDGFIDRLVSVDPARGARVNSARAEIERDFLVNAEVREGRFELRQPHRLHLLKPARSG